MGSGGATQATAAGTLPHAGAASGWPKAARLWLSRQPAVLAEAAAREIAGLDVVPVLAVCLAAGVATYFALPFEPAMPPLVGAVGLLLTMAALARGRWWLHVGLLCLLAGAVGVLAATWRTGGVGGPVLAHRMAVTTRAVILEAEARAKGGARLLLRPLAMQGLTDTSMPALLRVTARRSGGAQPGDVVDLKALLEPPPGPAVPGGHDLARDDFFQRVGGIGFAAGAVRPSQPDTLPFTEQWSTALDRWRNSLTSRIAAAIPGEDGAVTASQVTGKRGLIPENANAVLRASGLYHVVSISGLHMALFAGGLFWLVRAGLALVPGLALRVSTKRLAAGLSLGPAAAYTLFSGAEVATVRAFLMTAAVLAAVALGRRALTRRNLALAAALVLLATPEQVLGPSFQMSFAAVAMLVAWADRPRPPARAAATGWERQAGRALRYIVLALGTTLVASVATAPFAAYHFHRLTAQAIVSNLLATPLIEVIVMPLSLLAMLAEPFGVAAPLWWLAGRGVHLFMLVARWVAGWPGANIVVPTMPVAALLAFVLALVMLGLLRTRLAWAALIPALTGLWLAAVAPRPTLLVPAGGYVALARGGDRLHLIAGRRDAYTARDMLLAMGDGREPTDPTLADGLACDPSGCSAPLEGGRLMLDRTAEAVEEDCGTVLALVSPRPVPEGCAPLVIDRSSLARSGSVAVYRDGEGWRLVTARQEGVRRPWLPTPPPASLVAAPTQPTKRPEPLPAPPPPADAATSTSPQAQADTAEDAGDPGLDDDDQ